MGRTTIPEITKGTYELNNTIKQLDLIGIYGITLPNDSRIHVFQHTWDISQDKLYMLGQGVIKSFLKVLTVNIFDLLPITVSVTAIQLCDFNSKAAIESTLTTSGHGCVPVNFIYRNK